MCYNVDLTGWENQKFTFEEINIRDLDGTAFYDSNTEREWTLFDSTQDDDNKMFLVNFGTLEFKFRLRAFKEWTDKHCVGEGMRVSHMFASHKFVASKKEWSDTMRPMKPSVFITRTYTSSVMNPNHQARGIKRDEPTLNDDDNFPPICHMMPLVPVKDKTVQSVIVFAFDSIDDAVRSMCYFPDLFQLDGKNWWQFDFKFWNALHTCFSWCSCDAGDCGGVMLMKKGCIFGSHPTPTPFNRCKAVIEVLTQQRNAPCFPEDALESVDNRIYMDGYVAHFHTSEYAADTDHVNRDVCNFFNRFRESNTLIATEAIKKRKRLEDMTTDEDNNSEPTSKRTRTAYEMYQIQRAAGNNNNNNNNNHSIPIATTREDMMAQMQEELFADSSDDE